MAFPLTPVLDDFTRANSSGLGSNWTDPVRYSQIGIVSNRAGIFSGTNGDAYWNPLGVLTDCEAYATVGTVVGDTVGSVEGILLRTQGEGSLATADGYLVHPWYFVGDVDSMQIYRIDNGVATKLGSDTTLRPLLPEEEVGPGDKVGGRVFGSTISMFNYSQESGAWFELGTRTDTTYASGHIGIAVSTNMAFDDFGGGAVSVVTDGPGKKGMF